MNISELIAKHRKSGALVTLAVRNRETQRYFKYDADLYLELAKTQKIMGFYDDSDLWMDVGKPEQLEEVRKKFK